MKVCDLIEILQKMPPDLRVAIDATDEETGFVDTYFLGEASLWVNTGRDKKGYVFLSPSDETVSGT